MNTTTVGVDLAKYLFSVCMMDGFGRVLLRRDFGATRLRCGWRSCRPARWWRWRRAAARITGRGAAWSRDCNRASWLRSS